ncbi:MAG: protease complex subunit PrcB family protein [Chromatiaceae bacterium]|nr:MAG: protease complex subunit PrcB family protein [Chromatiaceae bacterium]
MTRIPRILLLTGCLAILPGLGGCLGALPEGASQTAQVRVLASGTHCGHDEADPRMHILQDAAALQQVLDDTGLRVDEDTRPNFDHEWVALIHQGRKPTLGYSLELADTSVRMMNGVGQLQVLNREPPADAIVAQALTSPCLLLAMERHPMEAIQVKDQHGTLLDEATLKP